MKPHYCCVFIVTAVLGVSLGAGYVIHASTETDNTIGSGYEHYDEEVNTSNDNNNNNNNNNNNDNYDDDMQHITKIVHPSEIRVPTLDEIKAYIVIAEDGGVQETPKAAPEKDTPLEEVNTLTYTELYRLLALWQWQKEHNFYDTMTTNEANTADTTYETLNI